MYSQIEMFEPILGVLNKIVEEAVARFLNGTFETDILLLIDHLYKKASLASPEKRLVDYT